MATLSSDRSRLTRRQTLFAAAGILASLELCGKFLCAAPMLAGSGVPTPTPVPGLSLNEIAPSNHDFATHDVGDLRITYPENPNSLTSDQQAIDKTDTQLAVKYMDTLSSLINATGNPEAQAAITEFYHNAAIIGIMPNVDYIVSVARSFDDPKVRSTGNPHTDPEIDYFFNISTGTDKSKVKVQAFLIADAMRQPYNDIINAKPVHPFITFMISHYVLDSYLDELTVLGPNTDPAAVVDSMKKNDGPVAPQSFLKGIEFYDNNIQALLNQGFTDDVNGYKILSDFKRGLDAQNLPSDQFMQEWTAELQQYIQPPSSSN